MQALHGMLQRNRCCTTLQQNLSLCCLNALHPTVCAVFLKSGGVTCRPFAILDGMHHTR
jgi:hypothetical protein